MKINKIVALISESIKQHLLENNNNNYFIDDDYCESNADNFEGEDGGYYYYTEGVPFAEINGEFIIGNPSEMHSGCAAKAAFEELKEEVQELEEQKEELEDTIREYKENEPDYDTSDEEGELEYVNVKLEELSYYVDNDDYEGYWENLETYKKDRWIESLDNCGRFWNNGDGTGVIACWSTPSVSYLNEIIRNLNAWAKENGEKIDFSNYNIAVGGTGVGWGGHKLAKIIPIKKYAQEVLYRNQIYRNEHPDGRKEPSQIRQQIAQEKRAHELNYKEKQIEKENPNGAFYGYLRDRGEQQGKKLGNMTMAQWNDMKYGQPVAESKK